MIALIIIGIMLLCDCSTKAMGIFCIAYGVIVGLLKTAIRLTKKN